MAISREPANQMLTDEAVGAGDEQLHRRALADSLARSASTIIATSS
jgi:hypothetical protein